MSDNERESIEEDYNNDDIDAMDEDEEPSVKEKDSDKSVRSRLNRAKIPTKTTSSRMKMRIKEPRSSRGTISIRSQTRSESPLAS